MTHGNTRANGARTLAAWCLGDATHGNICNIKCRMAEDRPAMRSFIYQLQLER
jgi:hypothetical protein